MDALLFVPVAIAISLTPGPNNFCGLNNGIRAGVGAALVATVGRVAAFAFFCASRPWAWAPCYWPLKRLSQR